MRCYAMCVCLALLCSGRALADNADADVPTAKHHFDTGTRAFNLGEFKTAAEEYRAAYKLKPDPGLLYNIAQAYADVSIGISSRRSFSTGRICATRSRSNARKEVEGRISALEEQLKQQQSPPNDVKPVDPHTAPNIEARPTVPETPPADQTVESPHADLVAAAPARQPTSKKWWVWTLAGVAVVGVGLGVGLALGLPSRVRPPARSAITRCIDAHCDCTLVSWG